MQLAPTPSGVVCVTLWQECILRHGDIDQRTAARAPDLFREWSARTWWAEHAAGCRGCEVPDRVIRATVRDAPLVLG